MVIIKLVIGNICHMLCLMIPKNVCMGCAYYAQDCTGTCIDVVHDNTKTCKNVLHNDARMCIDSTMMILGYMHMLLTLSLKLEQICAHKLGSRCKY